MLIKVTADHIAKGNPMDTETCPIALALIGAGFKNVEVGFTRIKINGKSYPLPKSATEFIRSFDIARNVQPFEFNARLSLFDRLRGALNEAISFVGNTDR